jgi:type I restriction enzyme M protein
MILHSVEAPNIAHVNTLQENIRDLQEKDRFNVVLANPPFGGKERVEVQQNFPIKSGETAFLFLQHFIAVLKAGGRAGIVIKNTFLSNTDNASISLRRKLLEDCRLHTVLDLPGGVFTGAGVKMVVLFFEKGCSTEKICFYQLNLDRKLGKTRPLSEDDLSPWSQSKGDSENSWTVDIADVDKETFDLSVKNPNRKDEAALREPQEMRRRFSTESAACWKMLRDHLPRLFFYFRLCSSVDETKGGGWRTGLFLSVVQKKFAKGFFFVS